MKGLILKDLYTLKKQFAVCIFLFVFYVVFSLINREASMLSSISVLVTIMLPITCIAYDERSHFDRYALSLPLSRKAVVGARYLLSLCLALAGLILSLVFSLAIDLLAGCPLSTEILSADAYVFFAALIYLSFSLPLLIKFGAEKGRFIQMALVFVPLAFILLLSNFDIPAPDAGFLYTMMRLVPVIAAACFAVSYFVSVHIYQKKEF